MAELLSSVGPNPATVVPCIPLHVEPKQSWPAFIGEVQEPRFSQIDTSSYAENIGIQADVIITDGAASRKSMYGQDRGVAQYIQKLWEYPSLCRVFCSFQLRDSQGLRRGGLAGEWLCLLPMLGYRARNIAAGNSYAH